MHIDEAIPYFASFGWTLTADDAGGAHGYQLHDADGALRCSQTKLDEILDRWTVVVGFAYVLEQSTEVALHLAAQSSETREMIRRWSSRGPLDLEGEVFARLRVDDRRMLDAATPLVNSGALPARRL